MELILIQGIVYFALPVYWAYALRDQLASRLRGDGAESLWILFSLAAGLGFGAMAGIEWGLPYAGTAIAIGLCLALALMSSAAATCLLASFLFLRPWELVAAPDTYLAVLPRLSFVICFAHLILEIAQKRRFRFETGPLSLTLAALGLWCFVATLFAPDPAASQSGFFNGLLKCLFLYFVLIHQIRTMATFRMLLVTLLASFFTVATLSIYETFVLAPAAPGAELTADESGTRLQGFGAFANANDIAAIMVLILPFAAMPIARRFESRLYRLLGAALSLTALAAIFLSRSRGAMLGVVAMLAILGFRKVNRRAWPLVAAGCALLATLTIAYFSNRSTEDLQYSQDGRMTYLKAGIRMGAMNPLFGVGFDAFPIALSRYSTESLEEGAQMTAHNSWILVFAETGVAGLILFAGAFALSVGWAWQVFPSRPEFLLALTGYGVAISFLSHSYLIYLYLLYALVAISRAVRTPVHATLRTFNNVRELSAS